MPKLKQMNKHSYEAALDLGATPGYALTHVIIPEIRQGIITVSYTHLDVYKRQGLKWFRNAGRRWSG